jgi:WD40 repeat protein/serine/threonine protein kinase
VNSNHSQVVEDLLRSVRRLEPVRRSAFVAAIADPSVRAEVESLLNGGADPEDATIDLPAGPPVTAPAGTIPGAAEFGGRYRALRVIGQGGMGTVYLAEQLVPVQRTVALKVIRSGLDSEQLLARFENERQALALMNHPNIAGVLDAGETASGQPYFVMELVEGVALTEYCDRRRLTVRERLELFRPVCLAVEHAHQKGIIHRDIKPSNILVAEYDGAATPKVIDFGLAKATEQPFADGAGATRIGAVLGTVQYMSPEQAESPGDLDTRSDIYSLGVVLYELLTGTTPLLPERLGGAGLGEVLRRISEENPPAPSVRLGESPETSSQVSSLRGTDVAGLRKAVARDLDWVVMRAIEKDRARRYGTATSLLRDLDRYLANEPVEAGPPSAMYRLRKFAYRNRALLATVSAFAVLLVAAAIVSTWQAYQARLERNRALRALHEANAGRLAAYATGSLNEDPERSVALAMYAVDATVRFHEPAVPAAVRALHAAILASPARLALNGHTDSITRIKIVRDGKRIVTASQDKTAKVWDAETGRNLLTLRGHTDWVWAAAYSPDGRRIATGGPDRSVRIWDATSGRPLMTLIGHEHSVRDVAFSPDGRRLASCGVDKTARVWDLDGGRALDVFRFETAPWAVRFSSDGRRLYAATEHGIAVEDLRTGGKLRTIGGDLRVWAGAFNSDASEIAVIGEEAGAGGPTSASRRPLDIRILDAVTGRERLLIKGQGQVMMDAAFSGDGRRLITNDREGLLRLWDTATGQEMGSLRLAGAWGLAVFPNRDAVVTATGKTAAIVDLAPPSEVGNAVALGSPVLSLALSPDDRHALVSTLNGGVAGWDAATGAEWFPSPKAPAGFVRFSPEAVIEAAIRPGEEVSSRCVRFSPDGARIGISRADRAVVLDARSFKTLCTLRGHQGEVYSLAFSPDGSRVATGAWDMTAKVWDVQTGREMVTLRGHRGFVYGVAFSPDGKLIATGGTDNTVRLWDSASGREVKRLKLESEVRAVEFTPDGRRFAAASGDTVGLWEIATGREVRVFRGHQNLVSAVAISPGGKILAATSFDGTARVWDLGSGEELTALRERKARPLLGVAINRAGTRLMTGDYDGAVRTYILDVPELMAVARKRVTRALTAAECGTYFGSDGCPPLP